MNFLFFISLIAVATANTASIPLTKLLRNPKLFAAAFAHADSDAVAKMIALVDKLIADGEGAKTFAIEDHSTKTDTHNAAVASLNDANAALATASGNADVATTNRDNLVKKEQGDRDSLAAAVSALDAATALEATTASHLADTTERVNAERESYNKIIELLESTVSEGRRLLSVNNADPGAVGVVIAKVQDLLATAEQELSDSTATHDSADAALTARTEEEAAARTKHTATAGELAAAKNNVISLNSIKRTKTDDRDAAADAEASAATALANALAFKDAELARIGNEDATLKECRDLLANINE
jgi:chromosome segregation ATPase